MNVREIYEKHWDSQKHIAGSSNYLAYIQNIVENFKDEDFPISLRDVTSFVSVGHGEFTPALHHEQT